MGNEASAPETRYKREVLKLSWRLVLTVQEQAASEQASKDAVSHKLSLGEKHFEEFT